MKPAPTREALEASLARRSAALLAALGDPWREDRRFSFYTSAFADTSQAHQNKRAAPPPAVAFLQRADELLQTIEIAHRLQDPQANAARSLGWRSNAKFAVESLRAGHVRTIRGIADLETVLLTQWHEGAGPLVNAFWREVRAAGLSYVRRDLLAEIFAQKRIRTREQYDFAIDQISEVTPEQAAALSEMIAGYASRATSRRR